MLNRITVAVVLRKDYLGARAGKLGNQIISMLQLKRLNKVSDTEDVVVSSWFRIKWDF